MSISVRLTTGVKLLCSCFVPLSLENLLLLVGVVIGSPILPARPARFPDRSVSLSRALPFLSFQAVENRRLNCDSCETFNRTF